jgi:hypothetical protein
MSSHPETLWGVLVYVALTGQIVILARLIVLGLWRNYKAFALWTAASAVKSAVLSSMAHWYALSSPEYTSAWKIFERLSTFCLVLAGIEAYRQTANNYPTIGNYGRKVFLVSSLAGLTIAMLPFGLQVAQLWNRQAWVVAVLIRTATIAVGVGLALAVWHFHRVQIPAQPVLTDGLLCRASRGHVADSVLQRGWVDNAAFERDGYLLGAVAIPDYKEGRRTYAAILFGSA